MQAIRFSGNSNMNKEQKRDAELEEEGGRGGDREREKCSVFP